MQEVILRYRSQDATIRNKLIYEDFKNKVEQDTQLYKSFICTEGFGEPSFSWNWKLIVDEMPNDFVFLEVGVYKGRVLAQVSMLAARLNKQCTIYGVTPLSTAGDKYGTYESDDYYKAIQKSFTSCNASTDNLNIVHGYSQDDNVIDAVREIGELNALFIDGCHDYDIVCKDILNYTPLLKSGGYLIMDDSSLYIDFPYGKFHGHPDVSKAAKDLLDNNKEFEYCYAVGHNRVWKKI